MIVSRHNGTLKDIRRLRRSKGDHALLEGPHLVGEALDAGLGLETVLATPGFLATAEGVALGRRLAMAPITPVTPVVPLKVAPELLEELADADSPRGLLAVARLPRSGVEGLPRSPGGPGAPYLYLDGLQDPGNLGALARVAEAAGAAGLALAPGSVHPNHPRALRGSAGSLLRLPVAVGVSPADLERHLASAGGAAPRWAALVPRGGADLYSTRFPEAGVPLVLALGAEGPGLSPEVGRRADIRWTIPLEPPVESLNAVVAAALVLFELRRRSKGAKGGVPWSNPAPEEEGR